MEASTMPAGRWLTRSPLYESSIEDSSPSIFHRPLTIAPFPSNYDIVFCMPIWEDVDSGARVISRWYTIKVEADCPQKAKEQISPFWEGELPKNSSFAAVAPDLYCFGGKRYIDPDGCESVTADVRKLDVARPSKDWIPVLSMNSPRLNAHVLVVDGKLHVLAGQLNNSCSNCLELEVFDPLTQKWETLPDDPPFPLRSQYISAALENSNKILVATETAPPNRFRNTIRTTFYAYDTRRRSWEELFESELDSRCPLGYVGRAVTVGNTLYWLTESTKLLAYNLDQDLWLKGNLKGVGISFLDRDVEPFFPGFVNLEKQKFCVLQCVSLDEVECVTIHVEPMKKKLVISVVAIRKYATNAPTQISKCLLLNVHGHMKL